VLSQQPYVTSAGPCIPYTTTQVSPCAAPLCRQFPCTVQSRPRQDDGVCLKAMCLRCEHLQSLAGMKHAIRYNAVALIHNHPTACASPKPSITRCAPNKQPTQAHRRRCGLMQHDRGSNCSLSFWDDVRGLGGQGSRGLQAEAGGGAGLHRTEHRHPATGLPGDALPTTSFSGTHHASTPDRSTRTSWLCTEDGWSCTHTPAIASMQILHVSIV
jgi:hypothetical protein